jgi:phenylpyruvate tautomerase PptA (4-oxalocrotonate tautomerase family)
MPLYRCTSPSASLNDSQRAAIAVAFTDIHCELTGAPRTFVHVQFHHQPTQAGRTPFSLHAGIRVGRDQALTESLIERCVEAVARIVGVPAAQISMRTSSTQASWILEGGRVLPEPGEEAAWVTAH